jgi:hypothetical protein
VPYVPGSTNSARPLLGFEQPILPLEERQTLLFFRATCLPWMYMYPNNTRITTGKVSHMPQTGSAAVCAAFKGISWSYDISLAYHQ